MVSGAIPWDIKRVERLKLHALDCVLVESSREAGAGMSLQGKLHFGAPE